MKSNWIKVICAAVFGGLMCVSSLAIAQEQADTEKRRFSEADLDNDGSISVEELKTYVDSKLADFQHFDELLKELDANQDGSISSDEFSNRREVAQKLQNKPEEFVDKYNKMFMQRPPLLDKEMGDVIAYDENGKSFNLKDARGKYTVLTFGCLT